MPTSHEISVMVDPRASVGPLGRGHSSDASTGQRQVRGRRGQCQIVFPRYTRVPDLTQAADLAWGIRNAWAPGRARLGDLEGLCRQAGCQITSESLRAAEGGLQGLLIPRSEGHFELVVDDDPPGGSGEVPAWLRTALSRHRRRFLLAHELAHTFFVVWRDGRGTFRGAGQEQEDFCDEFARTLLVPPRLIARYPAHPDSVLAIQRRFDVSMQVAARALDAAHEGRSFVAVLLRHSGHPDLTRPQWTSPGSAPRGRWWTGELVADAIRATGRAEQVAAWPEGRSGVLSARSLPRRRQVLLAGLRPSSAS